MTARCWVPSQARFARFHLSDTQLGALGTLPIVLYALVGLPLGRLADSSGRKRLLAAGVLVWASLTGAGGFTGVI